MDRRTFAAAVTVGGAAALIGAQRASAAPRPTPMPQARNVVLVHGAYADGSCCHLSIVSKAREVAHLIIGAAGM